MGTLSSLSAKARPTEFVSVIACLLMLGSYSTTGHVTATVTKQETPTVALCELISNAKLYDQKEVRVKAVYRVGYEWQELYCIGCYSDENRIWLDFDDDFDSCTKKTVRRKLKSVEGTYAVTLIGKLIGSDGRYGHMGSYRFKFLARCAERVDLLLKDGRAPTLVPTEKIENACPKR